MTEPPTTTRVFLWKWLPILAVAAGGIAAAAWLRDRADHADRSPIRRIQPARDETRPAGRKSKRPARPAQGYVGSQTCRKCHEKVFDRYQSHPMSRSIASVADAAPLEDYKNNKFRTTAGVQYRVERTEAGVFHHEIKSDSEGKTIYDQAVRVHYAVGSGKRGRTYLIDRGGLLFQSPITWYSDKSRWDLSPGYLPGSHQRFRRRIFDECVACHAGHVATVEKARHHYHKPPFVEFSIGCERCHGPGKKHVEFREALEPRGADPIVNPVKLDARRREAVCNQCHLHGSRRILRYGRTDFDFRPGQDLSEIWTVFVRGNRVEGGKTKAVSQVEQMWSSSCFKKSAGKFGCISCHDPHGVPAPRQRVSFYRAKCNSCHGKKETLTCSVPVIERNKSGIDNSCIKCHMPRLDTNDIPHTSQTDHHVLKNPAKSRPSEVLERVVEFDNADKRMSRIDADRARGLLLIIPANEQNSNVQAADALNMLLPAVRERPDDVEALVAIGIAYELQGENDQARRYWEKALKFEPRNEGALAHLAKMSHRIGDFRGGVKYLDRFFEVNRWREDLYGRHAYMLGRLGQFKRGIPSANRALELNPSISRIHGWLFQVHKRLGDTKKSRHHESLLKRLGPPP